MSPSVGVVIPCKNEIGTIAACLRSIRAQQPPVQHIVVVDNGSTDGSVEVAEALADEVMSLPTASISELRNTGARAVAHLDAIAFVDADVELAEGWLAAAVDALRDADLVGSRLLAAADDTWVARRWATIEAAQAHAGSKVWSGQLLVRGETFRSLGGFDETKRTGEDSDLCLRLRAAGGTVRVNDDMVAVHYGFPSTLRAFLRRERWHTGTRGWFGLMSPRSRTLVVGSAAWTVLGAAALAAAPVAGPTLVAAWAGTSVLGVVALGAVAGGSPRHALPDGTLMALWSLNRALRLPGELGRGR